MFTARFGLNLQTSRRIRYVFNGLIAVNFNGIVTEFYSLFFNRRKILFSGGRRTFIIILPRMLPEHVSSLNTIKNK